MPKNQKDRVYLRPLFLIISGVSLLLFILISSTAPFSSNFFQNLFPRPPSHAAGNDTQVTNLTLISTYESISVYTSFNGDLNGNNNATLRWRKVGDSEWKEGMGMTVDRRATVTPGPTTNPYVNQWRASVIGLSKNTSYEVQVTLADSDGISGTNPITQTITTRDDQYPSPGKTFYVAPSGADASSSGTLSSPFKTIQHAVDAAEAGDTILVRAGTYREMINIKPKIGADAQHFLTLKNFGTEKPIIDGTSNPEVCGGNAGGISRCAMLVRGQYIRISGFEITNINNGIKVTASATSDLPPGGSDKTTHDLIIENNLIHNITFITVPSIGILVSNSNTEQPIYNVTIQNNELHAAPTDPNWGVINFMATQGGHVIRGNKIYFHHQGTAGIHGSDCIGGLPNTTITGGQSKDTDIYNNYCEGATDDAISLDGGGINERVWNNEIYKANVGVSIAPLVIGPTYIFRNVFHDLAFHWTTCNGLKNGENGTGSVYIYHNTFEISDPTNICDTPTQHRGFAAWNAGGGIASTNLVFKNNILHGIDESIVLTQPGVVNTLTYDFNLHFNEITLNNRILEFGGKNYRFFHTSGTTTGFVEDTGQEQHGLYAKPIYVSPTDFHLTNSSPGVDAGESLTGFNDPDSSWPIQGLKPDIGAYEFPAPTVAPTTPPDTGGGGGGGSSGESGGSSGGDSGSSGPAPSGVTGDLNGDKRVDILDVSILLRNWGGAGQGDLNQDGRINILDVSQLLRNWGSH